MEQITTYQAFRRHVRPILAGLSLGLCLLLAQNAFATQQQDPAQPLEKEAQTCAKAIAYQERGPGGSQAIPKGLLHAISMAESGRWNADDKAIVAWPWTVTTGGEGHFLPNRADAVAYVKSLQAEGVKNIDVGCMQINLKYHPDAFVSIEHAFDPNANAAYAATFLKERFAVTRSWMQAAGDYHSTTPELNLRYQRKISSLWNRQGRQVATRQNANAPVLPPRDTTLAAPDRARTTNLNQAFRSRKESATFVRVGQEIANRAQALRPGGLQRPGGQSASDTFSTRRQSQLAAWRQSRGL